MTVVGAESPWLYTVPYLTVDEYKRAPTAVDVLNLHKGGTQAQQDAELANVIARASGWANTICMQNLAATVDTETTRARVNRRGELFISPRYWPVLEVRALSTGGTPGTLSAVTLTGNTLVDRDSFTVFDPAITLSSSVGALQFGMTGSGYELIAQYTYVNGWACTTLASAALLGATTLTVADTTGMYVGGKIALYDAEKTETVTITATPSSTTVVAVSATAFAHATTGISVSALPSIAKEAVIKLTSAIVKGRGSDALVMRSMQSSPEKRSKRPASEDDVDDAIEMLRPFRVIK